MFSHSRGTWTRSTSCSSSRSATPGCYTTPTRRRETRTRGSVHRPTRRGARRATATSGGRSGTTLSIPRVLLPHQLPPEERHEGGPAEAEKATQTSVAASTVAGSSISSFSTFSADSDALSSDEEDDDQTWTQASPETLAQVNMTNPFTFSDSVSCKV